jgi:hypothetical protein
MVICIFGESCTGKSTLASSLKEKLSATVYSGKDYLRIAKSEAEAKAAFKAMLENAGENVIYVTSEKEHLGLLPQNCLRVLAKADIILIKERFSQRMGGKLPQPVENMLVKKHGSFDSEPHDIAFESGKDDIDAICDCVLRSLA